MKAFQGHTMKRALPATSHLYTASWQDAAHEWETDNIEPAAQHLKKDGYNNPQQLCHTFEI